MKSIAKNRKLFAYLKAANTFGLWDKYGGRPPSESKTEDETEEEETELGESKPGQGEA